MNAKTAQLHVSFSDSASGSLRVALAEAGRSDDIVTCLDDFSFGPINPDDPETRARWVETELGFPGDRFRTPNDGAVTAAQAAAVPPIVWVAPGHAGITASFLWWLSQMEGKDIRLMTAPKFPQLQPASIRELFGREVALSDAQRADYLSLWERLKSENAPFRVLTNDLRLVSAPIDHFDAGLIELLTTEWQRTISILSHALAYQEDAGLRQSGDVILAARLRALAEAGVIDVRGDPGDIYYSAELRLKG
jgi:hypothetical protein